MKDQQEMIDGAVYRVREKIERQIFYGLGLDAGLLEEGTLTDKVTLLSVDGSGEPLYRHEITWVPKLPGLVHPLLR